MKKSIIALMGLFTLVACSEDTYQSAEKNSEDRTVENTGSHNSVKTITSNYSSPWDFNNRIMIAHIFQSIDASNNNIYVRITPYIGLGYYDGDDDGVYNVMGSGVNLNSGQYPNLYAHNKEYGNYVQANPIIIANHPSYQTHELIVYGYKADHCPLRLVNVGYNYNLGATSFDIQNNDIVQPSLAYGYSITPPPATGTPQEESLLSEYGKVMYYKIQYSNSPYVFDDDEYYYALSLEANPVSDPGEWNTINDPLTFSTATDILGGELYFHNGPSQTKEIVVDPHTITDSRIRFSNSPFSTSTGTRIFHTGINHLWGSFPSVPDDNIFIQL